jgi:hypothetical protein
LPEFLFTELFTAMRERARKETAFDTSQQRRMRFLRSATEAEALADKASAESHRTLCLDIASFWREMAAKKGRRNRPVSV